MTMPLPGLVHHGGVSSAGEVLHISPRLAVDAAPLEVAHSQEVRPQPTNGVLGDVRQRLVGGSPKQEAAHGLVDSGHVGDPRGFGFGLQAGQVHGEAFSTDHL